MNPDLSVVVVTYNRSALLPRAVGSILAQTFRNFELILVDNGSTDGTDKLCRRFAERDGRVRPVFLAENRGAAQGRNAGLDRVRAPFVFMLDDDDYCDRTTLAHLRGMIAEYGADIAVTGGVTEYEDGTVVPKYVYPETYVYNREEGVSEFLKREKYNTAPGTKLFRSTLFRNIRFTPDTRVDDIHVIYKLFVQAGRVAAQGLPEIHFCKYGGNMTGFLHGGTAKKSFAHEMLKPDILDDYLRMQDERVAYISGALPNLAAQARYAKYSYMISMVEKIENGMSRGCEEQLAVMRKALREHRTEFLDSPWVTPRERGLMDAYISDQEER